MAYGRARLPRAAGAVGRKGADGGGNEVRFVRSIFVPEDEICFFVFDAPSGRDAALAAQRAALEPIRVVEAVSSRE